LTGDFRAMAAFFAVLRDLAGADFFAVMPQGGWGDGIVTHEKSRPDARRQRPGTGCRYQIPDARCQTPDARRQTPSAPTMSG
jgi:hypothetical protein